MLISTIVWRLVFVNQYYNSLMEFLREEGGQFEQAPLQLGLRSCVVKNRLKIGLLPGFERLHEAISPLLVEVGN